MKLEATVEDMRLEAIEAEREQEEEMDAHEYKSINLANPNRKEQVVMNRKKDEREEQKRGHRGRNNSERNR